jgi:hypothetical protein
MFVSRCSQEVWCFSNLHSDTVLGLTGRKESSWKFSRSGRMEWQCKLVTKKIGGEKKFQSCNISEIVVFSGIEPYSFVSGY